LSADGPPFWEQRGIQRRNKFLWEHQNLPFGTVVAVGEGRGLSLKHYLGIGFIFSLITNHFYTNAFIEKHYKEQKTEMC
jgi:hypothetical protein